MPPDKHSPSEHVLKRMREQHSFQLSVDTDNLAQGLIAGEAALAAGITILEMGTPLIKIEGIRHVVLAFRNRFPGALLLADLKTMDGGAGEAHAVFQGGGNIVDFLALSGVDTARAICRVRDDFRRSAPEEPRLVFADILLPHQQPNAVEAARAMLGAGVDGIGVHLHFDARTACPELSHSGCLQQVIQAIQEEIGDRAPVQAVGGLTIEQACRLSQIGVRAIVISANLGVGAEKSGLALPREEIERRISRFIREVTAAGQRPCDVGVVD